MSKQRHKALEFSQLKKPQVWSNWFKFRQLLGDGFQRYPCVSSRKKIDFVCSNHVLEPKNAIATKKTRKLLFSNQFTFCNYRDINYRTLAVIIAAICDGAHC